MNQVPSYSFELQTNKNLVRGVDGSWTQNGVGLAWVYNTGTWKAQGSSAGTTYLTKLISVPADSVVEITFTVICLYDEIVEISFVNPAAQVYTDAQFIATRFIRSNPSTQIIKAKINTYANVNQAVTIVTRNKVSSPIDITITGCLITVINGDKRIVTPGNFKSLNFDMERSQEYWGASPSISGSIVLFGDDWRWLSAVLFSAPASLVFMKMSVTDGTNSIELPPALLDTSNLVGVGNVVSYKAEIQLLKDAEWAKFLSYLDEHIDLDTPYDVDSLPVIDGVPISTTAAFPAVGKEILLQQKFLGYADQVSNVSVPADAIYYIGFGAKTTFNDNFDAAKGVGTQETLVINTGTIRTLIGSVKLSFNSNGMPVEVVDTNAGWSALTSGVVKNINVTNWNIATYVVRVRNTTGAAKNFSITSAIDNNYLDLVTNIGYQFTPVGYRPLLAIKHYIARVVGDYDNLIAPVFNTRWEAGKSIGNADTAATGLYNPPSPSGKDYAGYYLTPDSNKKPAAPGTLYTGGTCNWLLSGTNLTAVGTVKSNSLMVRAGNVVTKYIPAGFIDVSVTFSAASPTGVDIVKIYGNRGLRRDLLGSFVPTVGGTNNIQVTATRLYDAISLEVEGANFSVSIATLTFTSVYAAEDNEGQHALTYLCNGTNSNGSTAVIRDLNFDGVTLAVTPNMVLKSLKNLFGLAMWPEVDPTTGYVRIHVDKADKVFLDALSTVSLRLEDFEIIPDGNLIYDMITVGGESSDEFDFYGDASSTKSDYTSQYVTTRKMFDQSIPASLNTPMFVTNGLGNKDLIILDMLSIGNVGLAATRYRLDDGLIITGSPSPLQPNWLYSESRIMRNNILTIFAGGSEFYRLMSGKRANNVSVDFIADSYGPIADSDPVIASSKLNVFNISGTTEIDLSELPTLVADVHKSFTLDINGVLSDTYIKKFSYNFASGKLQIVSWLKK